MKKTYLTAIAITFLLTACTISPVDKRVEQPYCHKDDGIKKVCTQTNAPSLERDAEAKQFRAVTNAATIYIVRYWGDSHHPLTVHVNNSGAIETVPNSMLRVQLKPGEHTISFQVNNQIHRRTISASTGEVKFLGISGIDWAWGSSYHAWADDSDEAIRSKANRARLIRDVVLN